MGPVGIMGLLGPPGIKVIFFSFELMLFCNVVGDLVK